MPSFNLEKSSLFPNIKVLMMVSINKVKNTHFENYLLMIINKNKLKKIQIKLTIHIIHNINHMQSNIHHHHILNKCFYINIHLLCHIGIDHHYIINNLMDNNTKIHYLKNYNQK